VTWDDHEVEDNYAAGVAGGSASPAQFSVRRAAAYQAYWEHLPLRAAAPVGPSLKMHRHVSYGSLANFHVLDTRQHRSDQVAGAATAPTFRLPGSASSTARLTSTTPTNDAATSAAD
jgi:alkaline phosphatase D